MLRKSNTVNLDLLLILYIDLKFLDLLKLI